MGSKITLTLTDNDCHFYCKFHHDIMHIRSNMVTLIISLRCTHDCILVLLNFLYINCKYDSFVHTYR